MLPYRQVRLFQSTLVNKWLVKLNLREFLPDRVKMGDGDAALVTEVKPPRFSAQRNL